MREQPGSRMMYPTKDAYEAACKALWRHRAECERLRNALALILPMAKGYAHAHPVGSNLKYIKTAELLLNDACPICGGDCAAANPPVANCPMR